MTGEEVRKVEFREEFRGYRPEDVDRKLEEIADALDAGWRLDPILADIAFPRRALRGYNREDVDRFIDRLRSG